MGSSQPVSFVANKYEDAVLVLSDGEFWEGKGIGVPGEVRGEICFNVSMTGYQEIMTDPSYAGQIINFTFPHIGNVGCNEKDMESEKIYCRGMVVRESLTAPSNFRSTISLEDWLVEHGVTALSGVDTRALARSIRHKGARSALIYYAKEGEVVFIDQLVDRVRDEPILLGVELASTVSTEAPYSVGQKRRRKRVVALDYGVKRNILNLLVNSGFDVVVVPAHVSLEEILQEEPDGVFLSNGPGDPFATFQLVGQVIVDILEKNIPLFGICLGHQLLALASGLKVRKFGSGHQGANHPVKNLLLNRVEITSQNHGFCVSEDHLPDCVQVTHRSLFDHSVEGIRRRDKYAFAVQYHPESSPGPHDSYYLFQEFGQMMENANREQRA